MATDTKRFTPEKRGWLFEQNEDEWVEFWKQRHLNSKETMGSDIHQLESQEVESNTSVDQAN